MFYQRKFTLGGLWTVCPPHVSCPLPSSHHPVFFSTLLSAILPALLPVFLLPHFYPPSFLLPSSRSRPAHSLLPTFPMFLPILLLHHSLPLRILPSPCSPPFPPFSWSPYLSPSPSPPLFYLLYITENGWFYPFLSRRNPPLVLRHHLIWSISNPSSPPSPSLSFFTCAGQLGVDGEVRLEKWEGL